MLQTRRALTDGSPASWLLLSGLLLLTCLTRFHDLGGNALWSDEAWVALSIMQPTFREATIEFSFPQTTPPLFVAAIRGLISLMGRTDVVLRLLPATASALAALFLWVLARRITGSQIVALLALALWVSNPVVLRYSQELKQYTTDALIALLLLYLADVFVAQRRATTRTRYRWALTGVSAVSIALSHTAALIVPTVAARWLWDIYDRVPRGERYLELRRLVVYVTLTLTTFALVYAAFVKPHLQPWVVDFWADYYLTDRSGIGFVLFGLRKSADFFRYSFRAWDQAIPVDMQLLMGSLFIAGLATFIARQRVTTVILLCTPFLTTLLIAAAGRYQYGGVRTNLFLLPLLFIGIAQGIEMPIRILRQWTPRLAQAVAVGLVAAVSVAPLLAFGLTNPRGHEDVPSLVATFRTEQRPDDFVAVNSPAYFAFDYYLNDPRVRLREFRGWTVDELEQGRRELDAILDSDVTNGRLWLVFASDTGARDALIAHVEDRCERRSHTAYENALLLLYACDPGKVPDA